MTCIIGENQELSVLLLLVEEEEGQQTKGVEKEGAQGLGFSRVLANSDSCWLVIGVRWFLAPIELIHSFSPLAMGICCLPNQAFFIPRSSTGQQRDLKKIKIKKIIIK